MTPDELFLFELTLNDHLSPWLDPTTSSPDFKQLMCTLGCRHVGFGRGFVLVAPPHPPVECEPLVLNALLKLVHQKPRNKYMGESIEESILDGLLHAERWRKCLLNERDAYAFVVLVIRFYTAEPFSLDVLQDFRKQVKSMLNKTLADWLVPGVRNPIYDEKSLAAAVFGDIWYNLVAEGAEPEGLPALIESTRPPFMPGILACVVLAMDIPLPPLIST
jgi:hypothetical protein